MTRPAGNAWREVARRLPALVPFALQRAMLEQALALAFREPLARGDLAFLQGRRLRITVADAAWRWDVVCDGRRLRVQSAGAPADVELRAGLHDFAALAVRRSDPDTLFFRRRLTLVGDTELGLACKNTMDALEPSWPPPVRAALELLGRWLDADADTD